MVQSGQKLPLGYYAAKEEQRIQDFRLGAQSIQDLASPQLTFWDNQIQYNQLDVHPMSCTIFAAAGAISDLTGYRFTQAQFTQLVFEARKYGFSEQGWYIPRAVDLLRRWWKREQSPKIASYYIGMYSPNFARVLQQGYSIVTGYRGNAQYNDDVAADGMLDNIDIVNTTYGHAIRITRDRDQPDYARLVIDNYEGYNAHNLYRIRLDDMSELVQRGLFFSSGYIFTNTMENTFEDVPRNAQTEWYYSAVEWVAQEGLMTGYQDGTFRPNEPINRAQMALLLKKLYEKLNSEPTVEIPPVEPND